MEEQSSSNRIKTFSIVTPSFNQGQFIGETIESVLSQEGNFYLEYIIMDGGSKDNTIARIKEIDRILNKKSYVARCRGIKFRWFTEKDNGQAHAINKGFEIAKGDIYGFLNSDDLYEPDALNKILKQFENHSNLDVVYGNAFYIDIDSNISGIYSSNDIRKFSIYQQCFICQPTLFLKNEVFKNIGPFNKNIRNSFDYEYWLRIYNANQYKFVFLRDVLASSRMYKDNKTTVNRKEIYLEYFALMKEFNKEISCTWKIGFARETSRIVKLLFALLKLFERFFSLINAMYSTYYFHLNKNNIINMKKKMYK